MQFRVFSSLLLIISAFYAHMSLAQPLAPEPDIGIDFGYTRSSVLGAALELNWVPVSEKENEEDLLEWQMSFTSFGEETFAQNLIYFENQGSEDPLLPEQITALRTHEKAIVEMDFERRTIEEEYQEAARKKIHDLLNQGRTRAYLKSHRLEYETNLDQDDKLISVFKKKNPIFDKLRAKIISDDAEDVAARQKESPEDIAVGRRPIPLKADGEIDWDKVKSEVVADPDQYGVFEPSLDNYASRLSDILYYVCSEQALDLAEARGEPLGQYTEIKTQEDLQKWLDFYYEFSALSDEMNQSNLEQNYTRMVAHDISVRIAGIIQCPELNQLCRGPDCENISALTSRESVIPGERVKTKGESDSYIYFRGKVSSQGPELMVRVPDRNAYYMFGTRYLFFPKGGNPRFVPYPAQAQIESFVHVDLKTFEAAKALRRLRGHLYYLEESFLRRYQSYGQLLARLETFRPKDPARADYEEKSAQFAKDEKIAKDFREYFVQALRLEIADLVAELDLLRADREIWSADRYLYYDAYLNSLRKWQEEIQPVLAEKFPEVPTEDVLKDEKILTVFDMILGSLVSPQP